MTNSRPLNVSLINMPFAPVAGPSIGLHLLASVLGARFPGRVSVRTLYLNMHVARRIGDLTLYHQPLTLSLNTYPLIERNPSSVQWKEIPNTYRGTTSTISLSGVDFLSAYWLGRISGAIDDRM